MEGSKKSSTIETKKPNSGWNANQLVRSPPPTNKKNTQKTPTKNQKGTE